MAEGLHFIEERRSMVADIKSMGIDDEAALKAMLKIPRHLFVNKDLIHLSYGNYPLPINCSQTISQPYIVAFMTQAAGLKLNHKVLEIGYWLRLSSCSVSRDM